MCRYHFLSWKHSFWTLIFTDFKKLNPQNLLFWQKIKVEYRTKRCWFHKRTKICRNKSGINVLETDFRTQIHFYFDRKQYFLWIHIFIVCKIKVQKLCFHDKKWYLHTFQNWNVNQNQNLHETDFGTWIKIKIHAKIKIGTQNKIWICAKIKIWCILTHQKRYFLHLSHNNFYNLQKDESTKE